MDSLAWQFKGTFTLRMSGQTDRMHLNSSERSRVKKKVQTNQLAVPYSQPEAYRGGPLSACQRYAIQIAGGPIVVCR